MSQKETIKKSRFIVKNRKVDVYPSTEPGSPVVYLNTFAGEGGQVYKELLKADCPPFTLVAVSGLEWDHDMAPWDIPPISKDDTPCTGGADDYLELMVEEILPRAEKIAGEISYRVLAGYSLAGLFAVYSLYQTDLFTRIASMSGSLWFPGMLDFVNTHEMVKKPECVYFSLGDMESRTKNPFLQTVQENTEKIEQLFDAQGIDTTFLLNPGNHYKNSVGRTAAGIAWVLNR